MKESKRKKKKEKKAVYSAIYLHPLTVPQSHHFFPFAIFLLSIRSLVFRLVTFICGATRVPVVSLLLLDRLLPLHPCAFDRVVGSIGGLLGFALVLIIAFNEMLLSLFTAERPGRDNLHVSPGPQLEILFVVPATLAAQHQHWSTDELNQRHGLFGACLRDLERTEATHPFVVERKAPVLVTPNGREPDPAIQYHGLLGLLQRECAPEDAFDRVADRPKTIIPFVAMVPVSVEWVVWNLRLPLDQEQSKRCLEVRDQVGGLNKELKSQPLSNE